MQVNIVTPSSFEDGKSVALDPLQGPVDPYRLALGHEDLGAKIRKWAMQVLETGVWPKPQMVAGSISNVTGIVQAEIDTIKKERQFDSRINANGFNDILQALPHNGVIQPISQNIPGSPDSAYSRNSNSTIVGQGESDQILAQLGFGVGGGYNGDHGDGGHGAFGNGGVQNEQSGKPGTSKRSEFVLVNQRNITITFFSGRHFNTNPYLFFNKAMRRLTFAHGADGEKLLRVLDKFEVLGRHKYTNEQLQTAIAKNFKVAEFDAAIKAALLNWTTGTAHIVIQHGVNNGFDVWRKLYNRYVPSHRIYRTYSYANLCQLSKYLKTISIHFLTESSALLLCM